MTGCGYEGRPTVALQRRIFVLLQQAFQEDSLALLHVITELSKQWRAQQPAASANRAVTSCRAPPIKGKSAFELHVARGLRLRSGLVEHREIEDVDAKECDNETAKERHSISRVRGIEPLEEDERRDDSRSTEADIVHRVDAERASVLNLN